MEDLSEMQERESSAEIRKRVNAARSLQFRRFAKNKQVLCNAQMGSSLIKNCCPVDEQSTRLLHQAVDSLGLSARAYHRILKIARTVADLEGVEQVTSTHVSEAIQYRRMRYEEG